MLAKEREKCYNYVVSLIKIKMSKEKKESISKLERLTSVGEIAEAIENCKNAERYNDIVSIAKEYCYNVADLKNENIPGKKEITIKMNDCKIALLEAIYNAYSEARGIKMPNNTKDIKTFLKDLKNVLKAVGANNTDIKNITDVINYKKRYNDEHLSGISSKFSDENFLDQSE